MKPAKGTTKKASVRKAPKTNLNVNVEYVNEMCDEAIATIMALRALVATLVVDKEGRDAR
jgi:hypothetical protein